MSETVTEKKAVRVSSLRPVSMRKIKGRFDAADTTDHNRRHWARADGLSADSAATPGVRFNMRTRCRYEVANNSYARGIVSTLANDTVGTGPRLQMLTSDNELNRRIETEFHLWAQAVRLAEKLRTMRMARCQDGESFAVLATNPRVEHPVQLDLKLVEADQITSSWRSSLDPHEIDGIRLDDFGNPVSYRMLKYHPGDTGLYIGDDGINVPASAMIHYFRCDRPGQHRGTPEIAPAIGLFAQLRRYTLAVLSAAESAADFAGILYTDSPASGEADPVEPMDQIELDRNMLVTMPGGWKMAQVEPQQPTTTYGEFKKEILNEIARCLNMPFNVAAGNSEGYNYASGRLDHQSYYKSIRVDQDFTSGVVLDRVLYSWLWEWSLESGWRHEAGDRRNQAGDCGLEAGVIRRKVTGQRLKRARISLRSPVSGLRPVLLRPPVSGLPPHQWFWDGMEHVDPSKEAKAQETRLKNHTTTLAHEYARQGKDWEAELRQRAREKKLMRRLGLEGNKALPEPSEEDDAAQE